ncbi:MAG: DHA2 family efflux MFS transporter permease subunit [Candidatus Eremiobacteraeota bacterium]|nr:DHA2 family efflux MFS transporter permease subunit [Candidatus Eremiobacteraeota bacterium]
MSNQQSEVNPYRWIILIGLITSAVLEVLDSTIVNVALSTIAGNLGATTEEVAWISTGYILSNVIVLPLTAWLSSVFGRRIYLTASIVGFTIFSFLCGVSTTLPELVLWRILQGAAGAALLSTSQATLREIFPAHEQGTVQSIYVLGIIVAPTLGPMAGGYITDNYSWPWIFFVNLPVGAVAAFFIAAFLKDPPGQKHQGPVKVDFLGISLLAVGLGCVQYVLEEGSRKDWFDDERIVLMTVVGGLSLLLMVLWELSPRNRHPVINFRVLKNRDLTTALILYLALGFGLYGGTFLFPLFAQSLLHLTPTATGAAMVPGGIATGVAAIVSGQILNRPKPIVSGRAIILGGLVLFLMGTWDLGTLNSQAGEPNVRIALILRGLSLGMLFTPINLAALSSLKGREIAEGASLLNLMRQLGGSIGIAALSTYVTNHNALHYNHLAANTWQGNPAFQERLSAISAGMQAQGMDPDTAQRTALTMISGLVRTQSMTLSYSDAFHLIGLAILVVSPLVFILREPDRSGGPPPEMEMH